MFVEFGIKDLFQITALGLSMGLLIGCGTQAATGTGDIDNDGDIDVAVSGDGDPRIFWIEQQAPGIFETHVISEELGQAGGMIVQDLDQDGNAEVIVTSYEQNVLHIFQHTMP